MQSRQPLRHIENARNFVEEMQAGFSFPLEPVSTVEQALAGADLMTGGLGHDTFVFTQIRDTGSILSKADVIADFEHGVMGGSS